MAGPGIFNVIPTETVATEALTQGQHKSPPKGYPKEPELYAVPEYWMFPLDTEKRVRSAIAYYSKHEWKEEENPKRAAQRILEAAKKFGIDVDKEDAVYKAAKAN